jgi:hypothetical protein
MGVRHDLASVEEQHCKPALLFVVQRRPDHSEPADKGRTR